MANNKDTPRGFTPKHGYCLRVRRYWKSASVALGVGDPVVKTVSDDPQGYPAIDRLTTGSAGTGVIVGIEANPDNPAQRYLAAGDKGYVLVADHPDQEFVIQDNGGNSGIDEGDINKHIDCVAAIDPDPKTGRSRYELDTEAKANGNTFILLGRLDQPGNEIGAHCDWVVKFNLHTEANAGASNTTEVSS